MRGLKSDDVLLVSYPRSGNTWARVMLAHLLYPTTEISSLAQVNQLVPDAYWGIPRWIRHSTPRVVKTHQPFAFRHNALQEGLYRKYIYLVRHPLDVATSFFDFQLRLWPNAERSFDAFAKKLVSGALQGNCSWQEHVLSWTTAASERSALFVRFEDMRTAPALQLARMAEFLGVDIRPDDCERIARLTGKEQMIALEKRESLVAPGYAFIGRREERIPASDLAAETKALICERSSVAMALFGYHTK